MGEQANQKADEKTVCRTIILPDRPTREDAFESHTRVARSIARQVLESDGGKTIALTGGWGSGKSTVVELLEDELEGTNVRVFKFDAWKHEGDNLRRAFLTRLIEECIDEDAPHPGEEGLTWREYKDSIGHRVERGETTSIPVIQPYGVGLAFTIPISLFCLALIQKYGIADWAHITGILRILGASSALLWSLLYWLWGLVEGRAFTVSEVATTADSQTVQLPEPSSIEFERCYSEILNNILCSEGCGKLVVVIDDLDRVDPARIRSVWSTMRVFVDFYGSTGAHANNLWLLVPYNPVPMRKVWKNADGDEGSDFIDKTFQTTVPLPPLKDQALKRYTMDLLGQVFPDHRDKPDDFDKVCEVLSLSVFRNEDVVTPRFVKLFLNDMGMLHVKYQDEFALHIYALAVAQQRERAREKPDDELDDSFLELSEHGAILDSVAGAEWREEVVAVIDDLDVREAKDSVLARKIEHALQKDQSRDLERLAAAPRFAPMLYETIKSRTPKWAATAKIGNVARTLNDVKGLPTEALNIKNSWILLWEAALNKDKWDGLYAWSGEGIGILLTKHSPELFAQRVMEALSNTHYEEGGTASWFEGLSKVFAAIEEHLPKFDIHYALRCSAETYFRALSDLIRRKDEVRGIIRYLSPSVPVGEIQELLAGSIGDEQLDIDKAKVIDALHQTSAELDWAEVIGVLDENLKQDWAGLSTPKLGGVLFGLLSLRQRGETEVGEVLERKAEVVLWHLGRNDIETAFGTLALSLQVLYEYEPENGYAQSKTGFELYNRIRSGRHHVSDLAGEFVKLRHELGIKGGLSDSIVRPNANLDLFVKEVAVRIGLSQNPSADFSPEDFIGTYKYIYESLGEAGMRRLVQNMVTNTDLVDTAIRTGVDDDNKQQLMYVKIYQALRELNGPTNEYEEFCRRNSIRLEA